MSSFAKTEPAKQMEPASRRQYFLRLVTVFVLYLSAGELGLSKSGEHVAALSDVLGQFGRSARIGIEEMNELEDAGSADILTEISRGIDGIVALGRTGLIVAAVIWLGFYAKEVLIAFAGKETAATLALTLIANLQADRWFAEKLDVDRADHAVGRKRQHSEMR